MAYTYNLQCHTLQVTLKPIFFPQVKEGLSHKCLTIFIFEATLPKGILICLSLYKVLSHFKIMKDLASALQMLII